MRAQPNKVQEATINKVIIHDVTILDGSGSMTGAKHIAARQGIKLNLNTCIQNSINSFSLIEFNNSNSITTHCWMQTPDTVRLQFNRPMGSTPLYITMGNTLTKLLNEVPKGDLVLLKILTDGQDTDGYGVYKDQETINGLIKQGENRGWTITFIGTQDDTNNILGTFTNMDIGNTLTHNNTGEGVATAFMAQTFATISYVNKVSKGEDVTKGFYKQVEEN